LHQSLKRFNVLVCHRRFGKTVFSINEMVDRGIRCTRRNPQYAYIAPTYGQAKRVAWDILKDAVRDIPVVKINEAELRVDIPRGDERIRFMLLSAENPDSIRGMYFDGVILDEYAEFIPTVWTQVVRPALSDRLGWSIFIGTPKGQNHFYDIYKAAQLDVAKKETGSSWFTSLYKASETKIIPESELEEARLTMSEEDYEQEYECSFTAALIGAYYGKTITILEEKGQICNVPHDPALEVNTYWDLGINDTTCIWFIQNYRNLEYRVIDYLEESGMGLDHYAKVLKQKDRDLGYSYGREIIWPHDGAARELGTGKTRVEMMQELGFRARVLARTAVDDGINASRLILPKCYFDKVRTDRGLNSLKNYQKRWDAKNKVYQNKPLHNWASHGADAWRTFAMGNQESRMDYNKDLPMQADNDYDVLL